MDGLSLGRSANLQPRISILLSGRLAVFASVLVGVGTVDADMVKALR